MKIRDFHNFENDFNIFSTHDAFRYARYALETKNNFYTKIDYISDVPDFKANQHPPPLLSQLTSWLSQLTNIEIKYFFIYLPTFLSVLFIIPLYYWLKPIFNFYAFIGGITLTLFSFDYFSRTTLGYFDTDCLMLFFVFLIIATVSKAAHINEDDMGSYFFVILSAFLLLVFRWWYDHLFINIFFIISLYISLNVWKHSIKAICMKMMLFVSILNPVELFQYLLSNPFIRDYFLGNLLNIESYKMSINVYSTIAENKPVSIDAFASHTTGNIVSVVIGTVFFFLFFIKNYRYIITAMPFIFIGFSVFYTGYRYLIFTVPFIGIGIGYSVYILQEVIKKKINISERLLEISTILIVLLLTFPLNILYQETKPILSDKETSDIALLRKLTEDNAYIWSWWDIGNPIQYLSGRGVFVDNTSFNPNKLIHILESFIANNEDESYCAYEKIKQYHDSYSTKSISKFNNPVYFFLNETLLKKAIASDISTSIEEKKTLLRKFPSFRFNCEIVNNVADCDGITINLNSNLIVISDKNINKGYRKIIFFNKESKAQTELPLNFNANSFMFFVYSKDKNMHQMIAHNDFETTMLFKMLIATDDNFKHFELVYEDFPYMVLYKVK